MPYPKKKVAKKLWWAKKTPAERSQIMSDRIKKMWAKKTPAERQARNLLMRKASGKVK